MNDTPYFFFAFHGRSGLVVFLGNNSEVIGEVMSREKCYVCIHEEAHSIPYRIEWKLAQDTALNFSVSSLDSRLEDCESIWWYTSLLQHLLT